MLRLFPYFQYTEPLAHQGPRRADVRSTQSTRVLPLHSQRLVAEIRSVQLNVAPTPQHLMVAERGSTSVVFCIANGKQASSQGQQLQSLPRESKVHTRSSQSSITQKPCPGSTAFVTSETLDSYSNVLKAMGENERTCVKLYNRQTCRTTTARHRHDFQGTAAPGHDSPRPRAHVLQRSRLRLRLSQAASSTMVATIPGKVRMPLTSTTEDASTADGVATICDMATNPTEPPRATLKVRGPRNPRNCRRPPVKSRGPRTLGRPLMATNPNRPLRVTKDAAPIERNLPQPKEGRRMATAQGRPPQAIPQGICRRRPQPKEGYRPMEISPSHPMENCCGPTNGRPRANR
jgi:hypothetical protein